MRRSSGQCSRKDSIPGAKIPNILVPSEAYARGVGEPFGMLKANFLVLQVDPFRNSEAPFCYSVDSPHNRKQNRRLVGDIKARISEHGIPRRSPLKKLRRACSSPRTPQTSAADLPLLRRALALVEVLVAHLRRHRDALPGGLGDKLRHPQRRGDVAQERHRGDLISTICLRKV